MSTGSGCFLEFKWALPGGLFPCLVIAFAAFMTFAGTLRHDFVWDDEELIYHARNLAEENRPAALAGAPFFPSPDEGSGEREYYRPISLLSLWGNDLAGEPSPVLFHGFNILLHVANSLLVFSLFRMVLGYGIGAFIGALLFAVHPVHAESVAWVSGRTDMLAAFFTLLAVLLWRRSRREEKFSFITLALGLVSFFLACLSKEVAFLLPVLVVLWMLIEPRTDPGGKSRGVPRGAAWVVGMAVIGGLAAVTASTVLPGEPGSFRSVPVLVPEGGLPAAAWQVLINLAAYLRLLTFPWPLKVYYPPAQAVLTPATLLAASGFLFICMLFSRKKHHRIGIIALAWTAIFLVPVSGILDLGLSIMAERFCYLPSVGWALAAGYALARGQGRSEWKKGFGVLVGLLVLFFMVGGILHGARWKDEVTLFEHAIEQNTVTIPNIYFNLGNAYVQAGDLNRGIRAFQEAIRTNPGYSDAILNLSTAFIRLGEYERAVEVLEKAGGTVPQENRIWSNKGTALELLGRTEEALASYNRAIRINPKDGLPGRQKGDLLYRLGRFEESAAAYRESLAADPEQLNALIGLGRSLAGNNLPAEAQSAYLRVVELAPEEKAGYLGLGSVLLWQGKARQAIEVYRMALGLNDPEKEAAHKGLVSAYYVAGRRSEAYRHVAQISKTDGDLARELGRLLEELEEKKPLKETPP